MLFFVKISISKLKTITMNSATKTSVYLLKEL